MIRTASAFVCAATAAATFAAEPPTFAGPAMGTTYRVQLGEEIAGMRPGEVHREVERLLARIDRAASTWRDDSDASRFNRAAAGAWVEVADDLAAIVAIARDVHARTNGAFDVTVAPLVRLRGGGPRRTVGGEAAPPAAAESDRIAGCVGMNLVELRTRSGERPAALRKSRAGVEIDLSAIAPGYAVDSIGARLVELGSRSHLVELGGEVRAWGVGRDGLPWRVLLRGPAESSPRLIELPAGMAVATATIRPGRSPLDPRNGRPVGAAGMQSITVRAGSCAEADALATAAGVLGPESGVACGIDLVSPAPSTTAGQPGATPGAP